MKAVPRPISRLLRDLFRLESLEPRLLLSADPVGVAAAVIAPTQQDEAAAVLAQYAPSADLVVQTTPGQKVLVVNGPAINAQPGWLVVDVSQLGGGNGNLVIGGPDSDALIQVGEAGGNTIVLHDLVLLNPAAGGHVDWLAPVALTGNLVTVGSGHTDVLTADASAANVTYLDSVKVNGNLTVTATAVNGTATIGTSISPTNILGGDGVDAVADTLTLRADGDVLINDVVGGTDPLEGLTITARTVGGTDLPSNVTFNSAVTLNGNLVIDVQAGGTVTFNGDVTLNGGSLFITGAGSVLFNNHKLTVGAGNITISADEIDFGGASEKISGTGVLTLRPSVKTYGIELGTINSLSSANTLNLDANDVNALVDGFSKIVIGWDNGGGHADSTAGAVRVGWMPGGNPLVRDSLEVYGGSIAVEDPTSVAQAADTMVVYGTIKLDAVNDITIKDQMAAYDAGGGTASDINLYSQSGQIVQSNSTGDGVSSEPIHGATLTARAAAGITLPFTDLVGVTATNTTSNSISITQLASGTANLNVGTMVQNGIGGLSVSTLGGNLTVNGTVTHNGSGLTSLSAAGTAKTMTVNQAITSTSGAIQLQATGLVTIDDNGTTTDGQLIASAAQAVNVTSTAGAIQQKGLISSAGGAIQLTANTVITMAAGTTTTSSVGGAGSVRLTTTSGNVTVASIAAGANVYVTAGSAILGLASSNPNLDGETAAVLLAATAGIGSSGSQFTTRVGTLSASNTASGGIFIREATGLVLAGGTTYSIDAGGTGGTVSIVTTDGTLTVGQAVRSTGTTGNILLQSGEASEPTVADLLVRADVKTTNGSISLVSADGIVMDDQAPGTAPTVSVSAASQFVDVRADGGIDMEGLAKISATGATSNVYIAATANEVQLGVVDVGTGKAYISAGTVIADAQSDDGAPVINVTAGQLRLAAGSSVGLMNQMIETSVDTIAAKATAGSIFLSESNALTVGSIAAATTQQVSAAGTTGAGVAVTALDGLSATSAATYLVMQAGGNLTVSKDVAAGGNLRLNTTGTMDLSSTVSSTGGEVSVVSVGQLNLAAAAVIAASATGKTVDVASTGGNVVMTAGAAVRTEAGALRVQAGGTVTLGLLDARNSTDRGTGLTTGQSGWGNVSVLAGGTIGGNASASTPDLYANQARLQAGGAIGTDAVNLQTEAAVLSARATGATANVFVQEATAVDLNTTSAITVYRVGLDGGEGPATEQTDAAQAGLFAGGTLVLTTGNGRIGGDATGTVTATGNLLLRSGGAGSDIDLDGAIASTGGHLSLDAGRDLLLDGNVSTATSGKTIDLKAAGAVTLAQGKSVKSTDGNVSIEGGGTVTLEEVSAGTANARIVGAAIVDGDGAGDTEVDVKAAGALLKATTGAIGAAGATLETQVGTLTANAAGGVYLLESDGATVSSLAVDVQRVDVHAAAAGTANAAQEDLSGSTVVLTSTIGSLVVQAGTAGTTGVKSTAGPVRLESGGGLQVDASIDAGTGALTLVGGGIVTLGVVNPITLSGGTVDAESTGGTLAQASNALIQADGGNIRLRAQSDVTFSVLDARVASDRGGSLTSQSSWGSVSVLSTAGSISDYAGDTAVNTYGKAVRLQAGNGIGASGQAIETEAQTLSAKAGAGGVFLTESSAVTVGDTPAVTIARLDADGVNSGAVASDPLQSGIVSGGVAVLTAGGGMTVNKTVQAAGNLLLSTSAGGDITTTALVRSTGANVDVVAAGKLKIGGNVDTQAASSTIELTAGGDIEQVQGTLVTTSNGNIAVVSGGLLTVEEMNAGTAAMHVKAVTIVDGDTPGDTETDFTAGSLRLLATSGIGAVGNTIETEAGTLAATATGGVVLLAEATGATVGAVGSVLVQQVATGGGATGFNYTGATGLSGTDVALRTTNGALTLAASTGSASAGGNLLLEAGGSGNSLVIQAGAGASAGGSMSLVANDQVQVAGTATVTGSGGTLDVRGARADLSQGSSVSTNNGDVSIVVTGTVTVERIDAGTAGVRISANRVEDGDPPSGDVEVDILAGRLMLVATDHIGLPGNALETSVGTASLRAANGVYVIESDALTLDTVSVTVNQVNGSGTAVAQAASADTAGNVGTAFILRTGGSLTTAAGTAGSVTAGGNLLLEAAGAASDITIGGQVKSTGGSITVNAGHRLTLNADVTDTSNAATIELLAAENLFQSQNTTVSTTNGSLSMEATGGTLTLEAATAGVGRVRLVGQSIVDGDANGDTEVDVTAAGVFFTATNGSVGTGANAIETTTSTISAQALLGGSVYLTETDALDLAAVSVTGVNRVAASGNTPASYSQSGVSGANVVIRTLGGTLAVQTGNAVDATGNLLLQAGGAGDLTVGSQVRSTGGSLSLVSGGAMTLNANVLDTWADARGTVDVRAAGAFTQLAGTSLSTAGANLAVVSGGQVKVAKLDAGAGNVRVSGTAIVDNDSTDDVDVIGAQVKLESTAGGTGATGAALETSADMLAVSATGGAVFITESDALHIGTVSVDVRQVATDGSAATQGTPDTAAAGLKGTNIVVQTVNGLLAVDAAASVIAGGNLLLAAGGTGSDLGIAASITAAGAMSLSANRNVGISSAVSTTGGSANTVDVVAGNGTLTTQEGSSIVTAGANVLLRALGDITVERVDAGTGSVRLSGAAIVDGDTGAGETEVDVTGSQLQIVATGAVGSAANPLETTVATLAVSSGGSITISETDALTIDATSFQINRVGAAGTVTATPASPFTLSDVASTGQGSIALKAGGDITLPANADVTTGGTATIDITSTNGKVTMQAANPGQSVIQTGSGDININAEGDIRPGALLTTGHAYVKSANGKVLIAGDLQRNGDDIDLVGDDLDIQVDVSSPGATLNIGPLTTGTAVVIGNGPAPGALQVDTTEIAHLQDGFSDIRIGSTLANQSVQIEGNGTPVVLLDPVVLVATASGGNVSISGGFQAETLTVLDSGTSTTLTGATVEVQGAVTIQDEVIVSGANIIKSGTAAAADLQITKTVTGAGGAADTLTLDANGGNVGITQAVSGVDGLEVDHAVNVTFGAAVTVGGDLVVNATGTVTFTGPLTLTNGGRLIVKGGGQVVFTAGASLGTGDATLEVDSITASGGAGSVTGTGALSISGGTAATAIHLGTGAGAGGLQVNATALAALGNGFSGITFGSGSGAGAGAVTVGDADLRATDAGILIQGSSIAVTATGTGLRLDTGLDLHANGAVTTSGSISTGNADVALTSDAGAVTMASGSAIASGGGRIDLTAAGTVAVGSLDTRASGGGAGSVTLTSTTNAAIASADGNASVDVFAQTVDFKGGAPGAGGRAVVVSASIIRVDSPGVATRDTINGRTYWNENVNHVTTTVLESIGLSARVFDNPDNYPGNQVVIQAMGLTWPLDVPTLPAGMQFVAASSLSAGGSGGAASFSAQSLSSAVGVQVSSYLSGGAAAMVAPDLTLSQRLLADADLSFASGQPADVQSGVDWWLESIGL